MYFTTFYTYQQETLSQELFSSHIQLFPDELASSGFQLQ